MSNNIYLFSEDEIELEMERLLEIARKRERERCTRIIRQEYESVESLLDFNALGKVGLMVENAINRIVLEEDEE